MKEDDKFCVREEIKERFSNGYFLDDELKVRAWTHRRHWQEKIRDAQEDIYFSREASK
jgi:hypothetical protein